MTGNTPEADVPSLYEVLRLAQDYGLVGEEQTFLGVVLGMVQGGLVALTGRSQSGKTFTVDRAMDVMGTDDIYEVSESNSETALYYDSGKMNKKRVHLYPDITSLDDKLEATIKANAEGKPAKHRRTDVTVDDVSEFVINPPDCIIFCVASDNEKFDWNDYPELRNRAFIWEVDSSEEQTRRIQKTQAEIDAGLWEVETDKEREQQIREHLSRVGDRVSRYKDGGIGEIINPASPALVDQEPIPAKFTEGRTDNKRLLRFMHAVALYHFPERMEVLYEGNPTLLVTPADVWHGMKIFGENLILSALNLRESDRVILATMREENKAFDVGEMQQVLRAEGYNLTDRDVRNSFESMKVKGYVFKNASESPVTYQPAPFANQAFRATNIDWEAVVEGAKEVVYEVFEPEVAEEYVETYCEGDGLIVTHPITGEAVNILEDTEFEEELEEAADELDEVLSEPLYGSSDDETDADLDGFSVEEVTADGGDENTMSGVLG